MLLTWTKGFSAKNAIGHDIVRLLQDAFDRKHMHVKCVALVNDVGVYFIFRLDVVNNSVNIDGWGVVVKIVHRRGMYPRSAKICSQHL